VGQALCNGEKTSKLSSIAEAKRFDRKTKLQPRQRPHQRISTMKTLSIIAILAATATPALAEFDINDRSEKGTYSAVDLHDRHGEEISAVDLHDRLGERFAAKDLNDRQANEFAMRDLKDREGEQFAAKDIADRAYG
jgi:hypothetical protein